MSTATPTKMIEKIYDALHEVRQDGQSIVERGMIDGVQVQGRKAALSLVVTPDSGPQMETLRQQVETKVLEIHGIDTANVILTAQRQAPQNQLPPKKPVENVKHVIAVGSGKGGVGKSTVAVNLAAALLQQGLRIGILDADIYGPSMPTLLGIQGQKPETKDNKLVPLQAHGMPVMSMGFLVDAESPIIWRGPKVQTALTQMLYDTNWASADAPLDVLIIDLPPGTGDVQLTLAQKVPVDGAIIVSTPQDLALIDARKAIAMFRRVEVPILGLIENMALHICQNCGHESHPFGENGAAEAAQILDIPYLCALPLSLPLRTSADAGMPFTLSHPDAPEVEPFRRTSVHIKSTIIQD